MSKPESAAATDLHLDLFADSGKVLPTDEIDNFSESSIKSGRSTSSYSRHTSSSEAVKVNSRFSEQQSKQSSEPNSPHTQGKDVPTNLNAAPIAQEPVKSEAFRKMEAMAKLMHIKNSGIQLTRQYDMSSSLEDMEAEIKFHTDVQNKRNSINLSKSFLKNAVAAMEFLNDKYDPFSLQLKGWSEQVSLNINDYDEVFGELFEKYKNSGRKMEPEVKLLLMITASAASFHVSKQIMSNMGVDKLINNQEILTKIQSSINKNISGPSDEDRRKEEEARKKQMYEEMQKMKAMEDAMKRKADTMEAHNAALAKQQEFMEHQMRMMQNELVNIKKTNTTGKTDIANLLDAIRQDVDTESTTATIEVGDTVDSENVNTSQVKTVKRGRKPKTVLNIN